MDAPAEHGNGRLYAESKGAICCDVLDAWFDPSPHAVKAFGAEGIDMRTSPDPHGRALVEAIAGARSLDPACITLGAGSSEIIYRVLPRLYGDGPAVILDPTYSEYPHVLRRDRRAIRRVSLSPQESFRVDLDDLRSAGKGSSLVVLVNPNNPTGMALTRRQILELRGDLPPETILWVDEAYVDYCPLGTSVEQDASEVPGLYVLKSLSKAYALSGVRAGYLACAPDQARTFSLWTPPWIIGTSAQSAAIAAVRDTAYYDRRWCESAALVGKFANAIGALGLRVHSGSINAVLVEVPSDRTSSIWAMALAEAGLIVRVPEGMGEVLTDRYIRIGLCEPGLQARVIDIIRSTI